MIIQRKKIAQKHSHQQNIEMNIFYHILKIFLVLNPIRLDPDPYQSSSWIPIRNEFFSIPGSGSTTLTWENRTENYIYKNYDHCFVTANIITVML